MLTWMTLLERLPTRDRLIAWGMALDASCVMCGDVIETCKHLFFECADTRLIWKEVLSLCDISRKVLSWDQKLS
ncbi:hypothetical protein GQ457_01G055680 [Hibiscus cannabinus]